MLENEELVLTYCADTKDTILSFPQSIIQSISFKLEALRLGRPLSCKRLKGLDKSVTDKVFELVINGKPAYRVIYLIKNKVIYVLHVFSKNNNTLDKKHLNTILVRAKIV